MNFNEEKEQAETAHILINDFIERINRSEVKLTPVILSAALFKKAGEVLLIDYGDSLEDYKIFVDENVKQLHNLFFIEHNKNGH